jgi:hypothetical protein
VPDSSHGILNLWKNYFCQLLDVCGVNNVRQTEDRTTEPFVPYSSCFQLNVIAIENLKQYKSPFIDYIPAQLVQAHEQTYHF